MLKIFKNVSLIGLLQFLGISNGVVELDSFIMGVQQEGKKIKVPVNSSSRPDLFIFSSNILTTV